MVSSSPKFFPPLNCSIPYVIGITKSDHAFLENKKLYLFYFHIPLNYSECKIKHREASPFRKTQALPWTGYIVVPEQFC